MLAELRLFLEVVGKAARTAKRDDCLRVVEESSDVLNIVEKLLETAGLIESTLESIDQSLKELKAQISESTLIIVKQHLARDLNFIESTMHPPEGGDLREHIQEACRGNGLHNAVRGLHNNVVRAFGGPSVLDLVCEMAVQELPPLDIPSRVVEYVPVPIGDPNFRYSVRDGDVKQVEEKVAQESALLSVCIFQGIIAHAWLNKGKSPLKQEELNTLKDKIEEAIQKARDADKKWETKKEAYNAYLTRRMTNTSCSVS